MLVEATNTVIKYKSPHCQCCQGSREHLLDLSVVEWGSNFKRGVRVMVFNATFNSISVI